MSLKSLAAAGSALALALGLSGCGAAGTPGSATASADTTKPLKIMADATPHTEILKEVQKEGLLGDVKIEVQALTGQVDANQLAASGDVDANFFQHKPYLNDWNAKHNNAGLQAIAGVHIEPLGLYSKKVTDVKATPAGAAIAIPQDATNQARALFLLQDAGLITLDHKASDPGLDFSQITQKNITANPKNVTFTLIDRPQLAASLDDPKVSEAVINGNYALEAGLNPAKDAKFLEKADGNPYVNYLVTSDKLKDDPRVKKLAEALTSDKIQTWIKNNYQGAVLPAKG